MSSFVVGIYGVVAFLIMLMVKVPIAIAMAIVGIAGFSFIVTPQAALRVMSADIYSTFASYSLSVIPMFVLMGFLAYHSGIGAKLYEFAYRLIGRMSGGLAMSSQVACAIFGAVCGSSTATAATIGSIAIPEMRKYNYADSLSSASVAAGGALGILIPPSTIFVIYGIATEQSISRLFLAGFIPGILLTLLYILTIWLITLRHPEMGRPSSEPGPTVGEILGMLRGGLLQVIIVFSFSVGGLFGGWFTPTEAGAVGVAGILLVTVISGQMNWEKLNNALAETTRTSAMILFLVAGAVIFTRFMAVSRLPFELSNWVSNLPLPPYLVLIIILLIYFVLGTFIEMIPLILLTIPMFYPVVVGVLGYDPIWFGVIIVMVVAIGVITPPVGINVYVVKGVSKDIPLEVIFRGVWPFIFAAFVGCLLLIAFPQIATFLPDLIMN
jgi:tripartite ATP-independent transporter DctM subunit